MKRLIALSLAVLFLGLCMSGTGFEAFAVKGPDIPSQFEDGNRMTDEEFLGLWNAETESWEIEGKLDYQFAPELGVAEEYVKAGDYYNAKEALLHYYQNRKLKFEGYPERDSIAARALYEGILDFETPHITIFTMTSGEKWYDFDVTSEVRDGKNAFLMTSMKKDAGEDGSEQIASFFSKEAGVNAAVLEIVQGSQTISVPVEADMYLRAGLYSAANFGNEERVLVSDGGEAPLGNGTRQGYLRFDYNSRVDTTKTIDSAKLRIYGDTTENNKEILLSVAVENVWKEEAVTFNDVAARVLSYNGDPDAYDWESPPAAHSQFRNVQIRLWKLPALFAEYAATKDEKYAKRAIEVYLDFIKDNGGLRYDTYATERTLNAAFRGDPQAVQCFFNALGSQAIDGVAFLSMLKLMWQEPDAIIDPVFEAQYINLNGLAFGIDSLLYYCTYFPEFKDRDKWVARTQQRILEFADAAIFDDGGYREATSGYDVSVLGSTNKFYEIAEIGGIEIPAEFTDKYRKFGVAAMNLTRPDKVQWQWGDGGMSSPQEALTDMAGRLDDHGELLYFATDGAEGTMPDYTSYYLPQSQLGVMRSSWGDAANAVSMFLVGRTGGSHGHAHMNNATMYAYGRYLLVDLGVSSYDSRHPAVAWQSGRTEAHNSVEINGIGQSRNPVASEVSMYTNQFADFYTGVSHAYTEYDHTRKVTFVKDKKFFIVSDFLEPLGGQTTENTYNQTWQVAANGSWRLDDPATGIAQTSYSSGANVLMVPVGPEHLTSASLDRNPTEKYHLSYKITRPGNAKFNTIVFPFKNQTGEVTAKELPVTQGADQSASAFELVLPDQSKAVYYVNHDNSRTHGFGEYTVDASSFYLEKTQQGELKLFTVSEAKEVLRDGAVLFSSYKPVTDFSVTLNGKTAEVSAGNTLDLTRNHLQFYAPGVTRVRYNGREVSFMRAGDCIILGTYTDEFVTVTNPDQTRSVILPELQFTYPLEYASESKLVTMTVQEGTKMTGPAGWDGIVQIGVLGETDQEFGRGSYGGISVNHDYQLDRPVRLAFSAPGGRAAWNTGGWVKPSVKLETDTFAAADGALNDTKTAAYFDGVQNSSVYAKRLADLVVYSDTAAPDAGNPAPTRRPSGPHVGGSGGNQPGPSLPAPSPTPAPTFDPGGNVQFRDISGHWAEDDILSMAENGLIKGYGDEFRPDQTITRAEVAAVLARLLPRDEADCGAGFSDVLPDAWYAKAVCSVKRAGIVSGYEDGTFRPDEAVNRAQMAKMIVEACRSMGGEVPDKAVDAGFTDQDTFEAWAAEYINLASALKLINGNPDGSFGAAQTATRAETVRMLKNMLIFLGRL